MSKNKHIFALFIPEALQGTALVTDRDVVLRIQQVLRLQPGDELILFNDTHNTQARIRASDKKSVTLACTSIRENKQLFPLTHWLLPVLERDAFEAALYSLAVLGATTIQPIITEKSRRQWGSEKDLERARRIMIAACEQAKQYTVPLIQPALPLSFDTFSLRENTQDGRDNDKIHTVSKNLKHPAHPECFALAKCIEGKGVSCIFFDPTGAPCTQLLHAVQGAQELVLCIGPEGDLTESEKLFLKDNHFSFYALTPSILRACDAVMVAQGIIRSFLK